MLHSLARQGITRVVATPHFYANHQRPEDFLKRREQAESQLRQEMKNHPGMPELFVGAEVYYFRGMSNSDFLPQLAIGDTKCIMIEMPPSPWQPSVYEELYMIQRRWGLTPIIAHLDRYIAPFRTHGILEQLAKLPVLIQANGSFFLKRSTAGMAMRMLKKGQIQLLGSDCHNMTSRTPNLDRAFKQIEERLGQAALAYVADFEDSILGPKRREI